MRTILLSTITLLVSLSSYCQDRAVNAEEHLKDSLKFEYYRQAAIKYPSIRQANLATEFYFPANVTSKLPGQELFKGKAQVTRIKGHFTAPVASWGKNSVSATVGLVHDKYELSDVSNPGQMLGITNMKKDFTTLNLSANFSRTDPYSTIRSITAFW